MDHEKNELPAKPTLTVAEATPTPQQHEVPEVKAPTREHVVDNVHIRRSRNGRFVGLAATLIVGLGLGWFAGLTTQALDIPESATWLQQRAGDLKDGLGSVQQAVVHGFERLAGPSLPAGDAPPEKPNSADAFEKVANSLSAKLDQMRASSDTATRELGVEIDRLRGSVEQSKGELSAKVDQLAERVDRLERQAAPAPAATAAQKPNEVTSSPAVIPEPPPPTQHPAIVAEAKPIPPSVPAMAHRSPESTVKQWRVREVLNGMALLEGPRGLVGVSPGQMVPGLGRVESIVRRGNRWVVATSKGVITRN